MQKQTNLRKDSAISLIEQFEKPLVPLDQTLIKDKPSKNDLLFNLLTQQWEDKRKCITDGIHSQKKQD